MKQERSFGQNKASLRRNAPNSTASGRTILVVTEGLKTEPKYLNAVANVLMIRALDFEIISPAGTDPITLTKKAIELRQTRLKDSKTTRLVKYDEVWVCLDLEKPNDIRHQQYQQALQLPGAGNIKFAVSYPCFEFWLLLHFKYSTAPQACCDDMLTEVKKHLPDYVKNETPKLDYDRYVPIAVRHAEKIRQHHATAGNIPESNPSTGVDKLIESMNAASREDNRFVF